MIADPLERSAQSFGDLITNLLAILVVVTLILLLLVNTASLPLHFAANLPTERDRILALLRLGGIQPFSQHFYVDGSGVHALDMTPLTAAIRDISDGKALNVPMLGPDRGTIEVAVYPGLYGGVDAEIRALRQDPGEYDLQLDFSGVAVDGAAPPPLEASMSLIETQAYDHGRMPNFIVSPKGFDVFTEIERRLVADLRCFRWSYTLQDRIALVRTSASARNFAARRCTL